jgi:hypothetical protein
MQRGKHISSYVKQGTTEGYVEIELKGRPGKKNLTVKRSFQVKDNKSAFEMNGKFSSFLTMFLQTYVNQQAELLQRLR